MFETLIGGIIGFVAAIFAEPVRQWLYRPTLVITFGAGDEFQSLTTENIERTRHITRLARSNDIPQEIKVITNHTAIYVRVKVENIKRTIATNCRAYLVNVEKINDQTGIFEKTIYRDTVPLAWSCKQSTSIAGEEYEPIDIEYGVRQFIDILSTRSAAAGDPASKEESKYFYPKLATIPLRYDELFKQHGTFRFTVQVSGGNARSKIIVVFEWKGVWNDFKVYS